MIHHIINTNIHLLYKLTEINYTHDNEVDKDDLEFLCNHLYRLELLRVFKLRDDDFDSLDNQIYTLFKLLHKHTLIASLIQNHLLLNELTTFYTLFSYDLLYIVYPILCTIANTDAQLDAPIHATLHAPIHAPIHATLDATIDNQP
jgi:hypothetical protein